MEEIEEKRGRRGKERESNSIYTVLLLMEATDLQHPCQKRREERERYSTYTVLLVGL